MQDHRGSDTEYVGVYRLLRKLGRGGMGEVYLAHDDRLDRQVAIKRIRRKGRDRESYRERFRREARAAAKLNHPAIAQVHDVVFDDSGDSIVMEYVEGQTVASLLTAAELTAPQALRAAIQIAEGLTEAHAKGFVHRDLKSANVMLTPQGQAKILDFGLAKRMFEEDDEETLTEDGAVLGTFSTMSPEQAAGEEVDTRSDLFSFGVLLYEMFTGHSPFKRRKKMQSLLGVLADHPPSPRVLRPDLPDELNELIDSLLRKDPDERPQTAGEVTSTLQALESSDALSHLGASRPSSDGSTWTAGPTHAPTASATELSETLRAVRPKTAEPTRPKAAEPTTPRADEPTTSAASAEPQSERRAGVVWRPLSLAILAAATAALIAAILIATLPINRFLDRRPIPPPTLRVLVLPPIVTPATETYDRIAFATSVATVGALASLQALEPIDPSVIVDIVGSAATQARAVAADEILETRIDCKPAECLVSLKRQAIDGGVLEVESFPVLPHTEDALGQARAVSRFARSLYPQYSPRPGTPELDFRSEDYDVFLEIKKRAVDGELHDQTDLDQLAVSLESSPDFLAGYLLAASIARTQKLFERALGFVNQAEKLAPGDPAPLVERLLIHLDEDRLDDAEAVLNRLRALVPGEIRLRRFEARLLAKRGRFEEAISISQQIVESEPSWRNILALAHLERRSGNISGARQRLTDLLTSNPSNKPGLATLAQLEILHGSAESAEAILDELAKFNPNRWAFSTLGWVRYVLGDFSGALDSYDRALDLNPEHQLTIFNRALALEAVDRKPEANYEYRRLLLLFDADSVQLGGQGSMMKAQCLALVGAIEPAIELTEETVILFPNDPQVLYQAAQVNAQSGRLSSARHYAEKALRLGLRAVWFRAPSFGALRFDEEFQQLLQEYSDKADR
ncbi:MAG: protein kinase [Acidobacteriota bacterium]